MVDRASSHVGSTRRLHKVSVDMASFSKYLDGPSVAVLENKPGGNVTFKNNIKHTFSIRTPKRF